MEAVGFFLIGAPMEQWADVAESIRLARKCGLDYVIVTKLVVYPGTDLDKEIGKWFLVDPWTGEHRFSDSAREKEIIDWERRFYRSFYFGGPGFRAGIRSLFSDPLAACRAALGLIRFTGKKETGADHPDYL
jgi:hypothetical protein